MGYQVDFLLPLKLQKISYYFGLCWKILLANQFAGFFTFDLLDLLILIPGIHCYIVLVLEKKKFPIKRKQGVNNCFNFVCFYYFCFQIRIRTKRKGKINLETKYNIQYLATLYQINENFTFSSNNQRSCIIIRHIFKDEHAEQ